MPGKLEQLEKSGAVFGEEFVAQGHSAGSDDGLKIGRHALANPRNLKQLGGVGGSGDQIYGGLLRPLRQRGDSCGCESCRRR